MDVSSLWRHVVLFKKNFSALKWQSSVVIYQIEVL